MTTSLANHSTSLLLTATIQVKQDMVFTARKDTTTRLEDYKKALSLWLAHPEFTQLVFVENSGADLSPLMQIAARVPEKKVEFLSFTAPEIDGALGKGWGEMSCLQHALQHSTLLPTSSLFVKATGRYFMTNAARFLHLVEARSDAAVICDMLLNLTWADSRVFAATPDFLRLYFFPLRDQMNDSLGSNFEHVLARAVHRSMADRGVWVAPPFPLQIQGVSGSQDRRWQMSLTDRLKLFLRHKMLTRFLATGPR